MGSKLVKIFDVVSSKKGTDGRMKLAEMTGIPRTKALEMDDSPDMLKKFKKDASSILGEDIEKYL